MGRIAAGWGLAKLSLRVVWSDGSLTAMVVLGGIASGAVALAFLAPAAVAYSIDERWPAAIIGGLGVYLSTVAATYFAVALAAAASEVLDGRDATVRGGMAVASRCVGAILGWAVLLTTVNLVLQALRNRAGLLGNRADRRRRPRRRRRRRSRERRASRVRGRALPVRRRSRRDGPVQRAGSRRRRAAEELALRSTPSRGRSSAAARASP